MAGMSLLLACWTAFASTTFFWREDTYEAFSQGKREGVSLSRDGELSLAPKLELVADLGELYVWSLGRDAEGNLYAGTGNEGISSGASASLKMRLNSCSASRAASFELNRATISRASRALVSLGCSFI